MLSFLRARSLRLPRKIEVVYVAIFALVMLSGVTAPQEVIIVVDGEELSYRTYHTRVADVIAEAGIELRGEDQVTPHREGLLGTERRIHIDRAFQRQEETLYARDIPGELSEITIEEFLTVMPEIEKASPPEYTIHVVIAGENLSRISSLYGLSYQTVALYNDILDPNLILVGQELKIPTNEATLRILDERVLEERALVSRQSALSESETYLLAKVIHWEARGEPYKGKVAVGAVVLNRVHNSKFPSTLHKVIYQPKQFSGVDTTAFANMKPDSSSMEAAKEALRGNDPTNTALYFLNQNTVIARRGSLPSWIQRLTFTVRIGNHWFYK
jgi:N-acetylmuramoyl-L-alanine amidase